MKPPRKDYGCALRVWYDTFKWTILPPRSQAAMARFAVPMPEGYAYQGLRCGLRDGLGSCRYTVDQAGAHLGLRVHWRDVPETVKRMVRNSALGEYCPKDGT